MEQKSNNIVDIHYQQTGEASATNELGMRDYECARMCALMIDCGEKKDAPHRMNYYLGWADRFVK